MNKGHGSSSTESFKKAQVIAVAEGDVEKELQGLEYGGETTLVCSNCDKELMTIMVVKSSQEVNVFSANCPFCDDESWKKEIVGKIMVAPIEDKTVIGDFIMGDMVDNKREVQVILVRKK